MNDENLTPSQTQTEKIGEKSKFIPIKLMEQIIKETDVSKKIIEETNSELWYETLSGLGKLVFINNVTYYGNVKNGILESGEKNQPCTLIFSDGTKYEGEVHNNKLTGKGKFIFSTKGIYTGEVLNGFRNGYGVYSSPEGVLYDGNWKKGLKHGKGKLVRKGMTYEGEWKNGYIEGEGKMKWENGNIYEGEFAGNNIMGNGYMIWYDRAEKYSGEWNQNQQNGYGVHIWYEPKGETTIQRNRYVGEWSNGVRNGYGIFFYSNGKRYEGFWENNKKNGFGIYTFEDGNQYIGRFEDDRMIDKDNQVSEEMLDELIEKMEQEKMILSPTKPLEPKESPKAASSPKRSNVKKKTTKMGATTPRDDLGRNQLSRMTSEAKSPNSPTQKNNGDENNQSKIQSSPKINFTQLAQKATNNANPINLQSVSQGLPPKNAKIKRTLNSFAPLINLTDLIKMNEELDNDLPEIENVLVRSLTDIKRVYSSIIKMNILDKESDYGESNTKLIPKEIPTPEPTSNRPHKHGTHHKPKQQSPVKVIPPKVIEIAESINTPDVYFCLTLKDIWRFFRDNGLLNAEVTICDFNRLFYSNFDNYYDTFQIPEILSTSKDIFNYLYNSILQSKANFINKNKKYFDFFFFNKEHQNISVELPSKEILVNHSIHDKNNLVIPRLFYEILIRMAYLKFLSDDIPLSQKLKNILSIIIPPKPKKNRGSTRMSISRLEQSFINAQLLQENKTKSHEKNLINEYVANFENDIHMIFLYLFNVSGRKNTNINDRTITNKCFYDKIIKKSKIFSSLIPNKIKYIELLNYFHKDKLSISPEEVHQNPLKFFNYIEELMNNEIIEFELCEIIFFVSRKYIASHNLNGTLSDYKKVIEIIGDVAIKLTKKEKNNYNYPLLESHRIRQKLIQEKEMREMEERRRQEEINRYTKERTNMTNEDQNVFVEEEEDEDDEDDEDDDY